MLTIDNIKSLMQPISNPAYKHSALLNPSDGKHAVSIALVRWLSNAKALSLTRYELPPDSLGRTYTIDIFTGKVVSVHYAEWAKGVHRNTTRGNNSPHNHKKGNYITIPHINLMNLSTGKNEHFRPGIHIIVAYAYKPLREQYAQAVLSDMTARNRSFYEVEIQINHTNKDPECNSSVLTANTSHSLHSATHTVCFSTLIQRLRI